jgi:hypothetical protein
MSLENGFKFKSIFYDKKSIQSMTYDELDFLISQVNDDINKASDFIYPYSNQLKNREEVPEQVTKKLKYKDACVYFSKDLKEELNNKRIGIERSFLNICREKMDEEEFNMYFNEAEKISIGV